MESDRIAKSIDVIVSKIEKALGIAHYICITNIKCDFTLWISGQRTFTTSNLKEIENTLQALHLTVLHARS
jgi:hypothetical protein